MKRNKTYKTIVAMLLFIFATVTVFMSSAVLFNWFGMQAKQGNFVDFIVKTNLSVGVLYFLVLYAYLNSKRWAFWAMLTAALLLLFAFAMFYFHIQTGGLYEDKTIVAMIFRILLTLIISFLIYKSEKK